jgi:two-component system phosphate regulon sensor histidine kinase PhoR
MMQEQTSRMGRLIEDLLTLSQIESNAQPPDESEVNMVTLIQMLVNDANALSLGKHQISLHLQANINIIGASEELQSALGNLVSNAVRYTPEGGKIEISWHMEFEHAVFSVKDNGIGIEQQHIDRLTERFYRVDRSRSRVTGGTGLGLSIVKHILTRHQAKLKIYSVAGAGSTFSVAFPKSRMVKINPHQVDDVPKNTA